MSLRIQSRPPATPSSISPASPVGTPPRSSTPDPTDGFERGGARSAAIATAAFVPVGASSASVDRAVRAAQQGDVNHLQQFLIAGGNPDTVDGRGRSLLSWAAVRGQPEAVAALLAAGADPSRPDAASGALPVHVAAQGGNVAVLRLLLERAPEQREAVWPLNGHTPLVEAAFNQRADAVALLLDAGADPGASSVRGRTPLSFVANETSPDGVRIRELLTGVNAPAQVDPSRLAALLSREGIRPPEPVSAQAARAIESATAVQGAITAITSATEEPQRQAAWASLRSLVDGGADLNALGGELSQPSLVFLGTTGGTEATRVEVLRYLLEHGADPFAAELHPMGVNAIFRPAVFGHAETLRVLLAAVPPERRADYVNQQGVANGMTPLHDAVLRASSGDRAVRLDVVRQLLEAGARVDVPNDAGETAADVARRLGNQEILALLG